MHRPRCCCGSDDRRPVTHEVSRSLPSDQTASRRVRTCGREARPRRRPPSQQVPWPISCGMLVGEDFIGSWRGHYGGTMAVSGVATRLSKTGRRVWRRSARQTRQLPEKRIMEIALQGATRTGGLISPRAEGRQRQKDCSVSSMITRTTWNRGASRGNTFTTRSSASGASSGETAGAAWPMCARFVRGPGVRP